ncbi:MAG: restriction endonuclease subunit S [Parvularculaceae bacterium]
MSNGHRRVAVGDLCNFANGNGFRPPDWSAAGLPIIRIQNLNGSHKFNYFAGEPREKWLVRPGDLLFAWAGVKGVSFGPKIWPGPKGVLNQHIFRVEPTKNVDHYWLYLTLLWATERIEARAHGFKSSLLHVQKDDITNQMVDVPPLAEQRRIAEILRTWDEAIEKLEALRAAKERRLQGALRGFFGPTRVVGGGARPKGWTLSSLGDSFVERKDKNSRLTDTDVVTVGKYRIGKQTDHFTRSVASKDLSPYWIISPGDFVYDPMSAYYGALGRYDAYADGLVSPAYRVIQLRADLVDSDFMVQLLRTAHVRFLLEARSSQGNKEGKRRSLQRSAFDSIEFFLPPMDKQKRLAGIARDFEADIASTAREITALQRQKRGLMQKLLTGEWRVSVGEATEAAE